MRSRDSTREVLETLLRLASIGLLVFMLWLSLDRSQAYRLVSTRSENLDRALREWSVAGVAPNGVHVQLDSTPLPRDRDWLAAIDASGSSVSWSGDLPAVAIAVQPVAAPRGGLTIHAAAPTGASVVLSDDVGALDTADARGGGARFTVPASTGMLTVRAGGSRASAPLPDALRLRSVLVIGAAGWESKFVVAALEEDGWKVDADVRVAPGASVTQGVVASIDTSRYSAVIALDASAAPRASQISRYVADGGGLILTGSAALSESFALVRAGGAGRAVEAPTAANGPGSTTLRSLSVMPVIGMKADAVVLDRRGASVVTAARRHLAGRVVQLGFVDTWRWRMSGSETSAADHRAWWTRAVSSVAHATRVVAPTARADSLASATSFDVDSAVGKAPLAKLIDALGTRSPGPTVTAVPVSVRIPPTWLFALLAASLLAEWASRRLRGAP